MCDSSSSPVANSSPPRSTKTINNPDLSPIMSTNKEDNMHEGKSPNNDAAAPGAKQNQVSDLYLNYDNKLLIM